MDKDTIAKVVNALVSFVVSVFEIIENMQKQNEQSKLKTSEEVIETVGVLRECCFLRQTRAAASAMAPLISSIAFIRTERKHFQP